MEKIPYIDHSLPLISTRQEWRLFSWRTLPIICARMSQEELAQLIGGDTPESDQVLPNEPAPNAPRSPDDQPKPTETPPQDYAGASKRPEESSASSSSSSARTQHRAKPPGEPNRPGSGGYSIEKHLVDKCGWTKEEFLEVRNKVHELADEKLNTSVTYSKQMAATINSICETVKKEHAIARGYEKCWVTREMLKVYLKNGAETARRRKAKRTEDDS
ncbi:hypothetical protein B0H12DRAFT_1242610 [Mycena haematopus]|nr:hypothetical protein B0H12DRAFT_1242610 [Mycena haematopus]